MRDLIERCPTAFVHAQAGSYGLKRKIDYIQKYPVRVNTRATRHFARQVAVDMFGKDKAVHRTPRDGQDGGCMVQWRQPGGRLAERNRTCVR